VCVMDLILSRINSIFSLLLRSVILFLFIGTPHPHACLASICQTIPVCVSPILDLPCLYTCSHDYSDTSVIVTQPDSINSYPG
jgi:hypothetical protein